MDVDAVGLRILGCLIEKQRTTPDAYPLSLNALRLACNQSTNRDPVVDYDEPTLRTALVPLSRKEWVRLASGAGSRAVKYRHLLDQALGLSQPELALLAVLLLRGPQTPGELKQRAERLHRFESLVEIEAGLEQLAGRELVVRLPRRPGQKEERYAQLLGDSGPAGLETGTPPPLPAPGPAVPAPVTVSVESRLEALERELRELRRTVTDLQAALGD